MNQVSNNSTTHYFQDLYANTFANQDSIHDSYLVYNETKGFYLEPKSYHWLWRLFSSLTSCSYELKDNAELLLGKLDALATASDDERVAAAKVIKIIADILLHPITKGRQKSSWETLRNSFITRSTLLERPVTCDDDEQYCLQYIAQKSSAHQAISAYVHRAIQEENWTFLEKLVNQGSAHYIHQSELLSLTITAIDKKNSSCALLFIKTIADTKQKLTQNSTLLHFATLNQLADVVQFLIEKDDNINATDNDGNTPLHITYLTLNAEIATLLLRKGADCSIVNHAGNTPLQHALTLYQDSEEDAVEDFMQILLVDYPTVQEILAEHEGVDTLEEKLIKNARKLVKTSGLYHALELALLLQSSAVAKAIAATVKAASFYTAIDELSKKYPAHVLAAVEMAPFSLNEAHFTLGILGGKIPTPKRSVKLQGWEKLFLQLNMQDKTRADYFDTSLLSIPEEERSLDALKDSFYDMLKKIENEIAFFGTPKQGTPTLHLFYTTIQKALKHVLVELEKNKEIAPLHEAFKALFLCMNRCGGRYYDTAVALYFKICQKRPETFDQALYTTLSEYRDLVIHTIVDETGDENSVHDYNKIVQELGVQLGLPGAEERQSFDDPFKGAGVDLEEVEEKFYERYTPKSLLHDWIMPGLNVDFKNLFLQYAHSTRPIDWDKKRYNALYAMVKKMRTAGKSEQEIKKALQEKELYVNAGETIEEAIEADRKSLYLENEVHDQQTGNIKRSFLIKALLKFQILEWS